MQAYTHFHSVFDVSPGGPMENAWAALVGEVRAWIAYKEKDPLKGFFFNGGVWTAPAPGWARVGSTRLTAHPQTMKVGAAPAFAKLLTDVHRLVPIVLVSCDRKTGVPMLDSAGLSRALAGTAMMYVCESPECDLELEHFVPFRFRSPNGSVRIYAPGVNFSQDWTSARHRFFTGKEIEDQGDDVIIGHIVRALTRSGAWRGLQSSITSIDDIDARVRERRLSELRSTGAGSLKEKQEMLALFESENEALVQDTTRLTEELEAEKVKRAEAEDGLTRREYDLEQARTATSEARVQLRAEKRALQAVLNLSAWPEDASSVAALAIQVTGERLVFTSEAERSLQKSKFGTASDAAPIIWRCIRAMGTDLYDLVMEDLPAQQVAENFKNRTKFGLTWTESKETKRDNRLMAQRRIVYDGREIDITPHVKWGDTAPRLLRVHIWVDRERKQLVIGHCGDHLDTYGTRRRG